ncbi:MAG: ribonuclease Z [Candidatus Micrarchaeia archaeon]|jgi:ribonuclease Z
MIRVVVLGSGASVPSVQRNLASVAVRHDGDVYLFDCGEGTQRQMMRFRMSYAKTKAIFISHLDADHYLGVAGLCHTLNMIGRKPTEKLLVFGPRGTARKIEGLGCNYGFLQVHDVGEGEAYKGEGFAVSAFAVKHGSNSLGYSFEESTGRNFDKAKCDKLGIKGLMFRELEQKGEVIVGKKKIAIEDVTIPKKGRKIVYTGDTMKCDAVVKAAKGADLLVHEGTFGDELKKEAEEKEHATVSDAAKVAKEAKVKKLVITHISNRYEDASGLLKEARKIFAQSEIAHDGLEIEL